MRLGFDLDGVLASFDVGYREVLEQVIRKPLPDDEPTVWEWPRQLGITEEQEAEAWDRIEHSRDFWATLPNAPGFNRDVCDRLIEIAERNDVYFLTDRPTRGAKGQTETWLDHRSLPPSVLITGGRKGHAAYALNLDVFVDDKPTNVYDVVKHSPATRAYIFRRPWNASHQGGEIVTNLPELFDLEAL